LWGSIFRAAVELGDYDQAFTAMRREEFSALQFESRQGGMKERRYSQVSNFVVVLCEKGELDKLCQLPWAQEWGWEEVEKVQDVLRGYARFSNVENTGIEELMVIDRYEDVAADHLGGVEQEEDEAIMAVDFYRALYAFLIQQGNFREAAIEMYRVYTRYGVMSPLCIAYNHPQGNLRKSYW